MEEERAEGSTLAGAVDSEAQKGSPDAGVQQRGKWANKTEFLLSMAGEIIGLGNVWRFPYLCYKNGGGVFFIPYFVFLFFCGIPVFFLETALGQYTSEGGVTAWRKICPMFEGVGIASQVIVLYLNVYYIVILAWALFYLLNSFRNPLPWAVCNNYWNSVECRYHASSNPHIIQPMSNWSFLYNGSYATYPTSESDSDYVDLSDYPEWNSTFTPQYPEEEFWIHRVLRMSGDMSLVKVHWDLALCLLAVWVICYFCIWKGVKSTGKVVYFTATFPYLMLIILLIRGLSLPGAWDGIKYYLYPDFKRITDPGVWRDAGTQVFFSYAVCQGVLTALGSYNKYNNDCYKDCIALCVLNSGTSIFAGLVVFSILGFMGHALNVDIAEVAASGPGLAFIVYPKVLSMLPGAQVWCVLFFLMILFLGLDSQFVCVESLATAITDMFPHVLRRPGRRELLVLSIAVFCFLLGLPLVSEGGMMLFQLIDSYGPSGTCLLFIACCETMVIGWVYGADRFYDNITDMIGYRPFPVLKYCWLFFTPLICWITLTYDLHVSLPMGPIYGYEPGLWAEVVGPLLIFVPLICIPIWMLRALYKDSAGMTRPSGDLRQAWPHNPRLTVCGCVVAEGKRKPTRADAEISLKPVVEEDTTGV